MRTGCAEKPVVSSEGCFLATTLHYIHMSTREELALRSTIEKLLTQEAASQDKVLQCQKRMLAAGSGSKPAHFVRGCIAEDRLLLRWTTLCMRRHLHNEAAFVLSKAFRMRQMRLLAADAEGSSDRSASSVNDNQEAAVREQFAAQRQAARRRTRDRLTGIRRLREALRTEVFEIFSESMGTHDRKARNIARRLNELGHNTAGDKHRAKQVKIQVQEMQEMQVRNAEPQCTMLMEWRAGALVARASTVTQKHHDLMFPPPPQASTPPHPPTRPITRGVDRFMHLRPFVMTR